MMFSSTAAVQRCVDMAVRDLSWNMLLIKHFPYRNDICHLCFDLLICHSHAQSDMWEWTYHNHYWEFTVWHIIDFQ